MYLRESNFTDMNYRGKMSEEKQHFLLNFSFISSDEVKNQTFKVPKLLFSEKFGVHSPNHPIDLEKNTTSPSDIKNWTNGSKHFGLISFIIILIFLLICFGIIFLYKKWKRGFGYRIRNSSRSLSYDSGIGGCSKEHIEMKIIYTGPKVEVKV